MNYNQTSSATSWLGRVLVDPEEEDGVRLFVEDQEEERMIRLKLRVEQRPGGAEAEQSRGSGGFTSFFVDFNEGLVLGGVKADGVVFAAVLVQEASQVGVPAK